MSGLCYSLHAGKVQFSFYLLLHVQHLPFFQCLEEQTADFGLLFRFFFFCWRCEFRGQDLHAVFRQIVYSAVYVPMSQREDLLLFGVVLHDMSAVLTSLLRLGKTTDVFVSSC